MNQHLSWLDRSLLLIISAEAAGAVVVQWRVRRRWTLLWSRILAPMTAATAMVFVIAYQVLLWSQVEPVGFQTVLRGMGLVAWPLVWIYPAAYRLRRDPADLLVTAFEERLQENGR